jgi:hypothetical protein
VKPSFAREVKIECSATRASMLHLRRQGIVYRARIDELCLAALGRHRMRVQQRILGGDALEGGVGVPELIAEREHAPPVVPA